MIKMQIAPNALNLLESLPKSDQNNDLVEYWRKSKQKVQEQNNGVNNLRQIRSNESSRNNPLNKMNENRRQVKFNYD